MLLTADGHPIYVEAPAMVPLKSGVALIGFPTYLWQSPKVFSDTGALGFPMMDRSNAFVGAVVRPDGVGVPIPRPPGATIMRVPHAVAGRNNTAEVVWNPAPDSSLAPGFGGNELWHAQFDGEHWSTPTKIFEAERISWNNSQPALAIVDGEPQVAAPAYGKLGDTYHSGIVVVRRANGRWLSTWIETSSLPPGYVTIAATPSGDPIVAFIGAMADRAGKPVSGVYVVRSSNHGTAWRPPERGRRCRASRLPEESTRSLPWPFQTTS